MGGQKTIICDSLIYPYTTKTSLQSSNWWYRGWTVRLSTTDSEANYPLNFILTSSFVENLHADFHCGIGILAKKLEACLGDLGVYKS